MVFHDRQRIEKIHRDISALPKSNYTVAYCLRNKQPNPLSLSPQNTLQPTRAIGPKMSLIKKSDNNYLA